MRFLRARAAAAGLSLLALVISTPDAIAVPVEVTGGTATLSLPLNDINAPPATLIDVSPDLTRLATGKTVVDLGSPINANTATDRPTTATFDTADPAGTFAGTIELRGFVTYLIPGPSNTVELGDFSLAYDPARAGTLNGQASGFFLRDNRPGAPDIPFDIGADGLRFSANTSTLSFFGTMLTAPDLNARYEPFVGSVLGRPFGAIQLSATVQPTAVPLPPALLPALATLAGITLLPLARRRRAA